MGTVTELPGLHREQDTSAPASTVTADSTYWQSAQDCTSGALAKSARCCLRMHIMNHVIAYAPTLLYTLVETAWTHKKRLMLSRTSCTLTIIKTELTSCVEATNLGREWCYTQFLVHSECLNDSVAGIVWIEIVGFHF